MTTGKGVKAQEKALVRRYLVWCYKTTKESLDRVDRKFTQAAVDRYVLADLLKVKGPKETQESYRKSVEDFEQYIANKEKEGLQQKFADGNKDALNPQYFYLRSRLSAIESAIRYFLGPRELAKIDLLYEQEMTRRILEAREH